MAGVPKPTPLLAFTDNYGDARELLDLARALTNTRQRRMRRELREKVGEALGINQGQWGDIDCSESDDVFVVIKPASAFTRDVFQHQQAMLRQAVVAGCTALETYVADKTISQVRGIIGKSNRTGDLPVGLASMRLRLDTWEKVERYQRRRRAITDHFVKGEIGQLASSHPEKIKNLLKMTGLEDPLGQVDDQRRCAAGATKSELAALNTRRNKIAHSGDRDGRGRAQITTDEVEHYLSVIQSVVRAIEEIL